MPPRYVYWTILIDGKPTAFRAHEKEELLPTFNQLRRTNKDVVFKWFARGRVWDSPEAASTAAERPAPREKRGRDWRPGGEHADPRARFKKKSGARSHDTRPPDGRSGGSGESRPSRDKPSGQARGSRPWSGKPPSGAPRADRPASNRPPRSAPRGVRPWSNKPPGGPARGDRPGRDQKPGVAQVFRPAKDRNSFRPPPKSVPEPSRPPDPPVPPDPSVVKPERPKRG